MHPIIAEEIARDHAARLHASAETARLRATVRAARPRNDHPVRHRVAEVLVAVAARLDPPVVQRRAC